jgi:hypothetical protein
MKTARMSADCIELLRVLALAGVLIGSIAGEVTAFIRADGGETGLIAWLTKLLLLYAFSLINPRVVRSLWAGAAHRTMLRSGIEFLADEGMYHIVLNFRRRLTMPRYH